LLKGVAIFIFKSHVNSFHYLYQDAEHFHAQARSDDAGFDGVRAARTALLLYILSLEGLINRALEAFLPEPLRSFFLEREDRFSLEDKWQLLPLIAGDDGPKAFDKSRDVWARFVELVRLRNEFVHPKHNRPAYYEARTTANWTPLSWNAIPKGLPLKETDLIYRQTQIPRDPYAVRVDHVDTAKAAVDAVVAELDQLLGGRITAGGWHHSDGMSLIWPVGATVADIPKDDAV
jgi:hypothetical protein